MGQRHVPVLILIPSLCCVQVGDQAQLPAPDGRRDSRHGQPRAVLRLLLHDCRRAEAEGRRVRREVHDDTAGRRGRGFGQQVGG